MGKRSRKRATTDAPMGVDEPVAKPRPSASAPRALDRKARLDEAPKAAWSPFPLTELCILLGMILMAVGLFTTGNNRGLILGSGVILLTMASGELAVREHFAGYRSHSGLISAIGAVAAATPLYLLTNVPPEAILVASAIVFGIGFKVLRDLFADRSGGLKFRA